MREEVTLSLSKAFDIQPGTRDPLVLPSKPGHADYQSNVAMSLAKSLRMPPKDVAQKILASLRTSTDYSSAVIGHVDVSGPGFINLYLSSDFMAQRILSKAKDKSNRLGIATVTQPQKVVVDFSSPNIAKEMHVVSIV
jgi:arginyl-tRNA synthetase